MASRLDADRGNRLCAALDRAGVSNQDLALKAGVSPSTVTGWRKGAEIRCHHLAIVCPHLDISMDHLVAGLPGPSLEEVQLLRYFHTLSPRTSTAVLGLIKNLAPSS